MGKGDEVIVVDELVELGELEELVELVCAGEM